MKRALFVTTASNELYMPVAAWRNNMGPCAHITYNPAGPPNDESIIACAKGYEPEVIFYIGANSGPCLPLIPTLKELREIAPCILYQSDVEDEAWFDLLKTYRKEGCFNLFASQTGVKTDLIDMATLMAVDIEAYRGPLKKTCFCGFSGSARDIPTYQPGIDEFDGRAEILYDLRKEVHFRPREPAGIYSNYAYYLKRCLIALNVSLTGSGKRHHVKWRVLEAAFADCALLEMADSPTSNWFPDGHYFVYRNAADIRRMMRTTKIEEVKRVASLFSNYAREHYTPRQIFNGMLEAL